MSVYFSRTAFRSMSERISFWTRLPFLTFRWSSFAALFFTVFWVYFLKGLISSRVDPLENTCLHILRFRSYPLGNVLALLLSFHDRFTKVIHFFSRFGSLLWLFGLDSQRPIQLHKGVFNKEDFSSRRRWRLFKAAPSASLFHGTTG